MLATFFDLVGPDIVVLLLVFMTIAFPIWMLIDCIKHESDKVAWIVLILFVPWLGSILYYFMRRSRRRKPLLKK